MTTKATVLISIIVFGLAAAGLTAAGVFDPLLSLDPTPVPDPPPPIVQDQQGPTPPAKPTLNGTPVPDTPRVTYRFQQSYYGWLWAIPVEPVHPDTMGMFTRMNSVGGWSSTPLDSCWVALPAKAIAGNFWEYREGWTGTYHRVDVNQVLDEAVGVGNMALNPVDVPITEPLMESRRSSTWKMEPDEYETSVFDSWNDDHERCVSPPTEG